MNQYDQSPAFEALVAAVGDLRDNASLIEGDEIHMIGVRNEKWRLARSQMRRQHARASAMRALANRLELEALELSHQMSKRK